MTIEETIQHCEEVAAGETEQGKCPECAAEHKKLAGWLKELLAIRAQQTPLDRSRWEGCKHCRGDLEGYTKPFKAPYGCGLMFISEGKAEIVSTGKGNRIKTKISYCPFCGRPLTESVWAELERRINGGKADS